MSQQRTHTIQCPKCGREQPVELYDSINVKDSPGLRDRLIANQINIVTCEGCGATFRVDKNLLYHDPGHGFMVYLAPRFDEAPDAAEREFTESLRELNCALPKGIKAPYVTLVATRSELVERIFLLEAGLNERVIEYIKHLIYSKNIERVDPLRKNLLFDAQDSTPETLCFVVQDAGTRRLEAMLQYDRKTYTAMCEMFDRDDQTGALLELFPGPRISARAVFQREAVDPKAPRPAES